MGVAVLNPVLATPQCIDSLAFFDNITVNFHNLRLQGTFLHCFALGPSLEHPPHRSSCVTSIRKNRMNNLTRVESETA